MSKRVFFWVPSALVLASATAAAQGTVQCVGKVGEYAGADSVYVEGIGGVDCREEGICAADKRCQKAVEVDPVSGIRREWCGCPGEGEPRDRCHTVFVAKQGEPGKGKLDCFWDCPNRAEKCCEVLVSSRADVTSAGQIQGYINRYSCRCLPPDDLVNGSCPEVNRPRPKPSRSGDRRQGR